MVCTYFQDEPHSRPRQGSVTGVILHGEIADLNELLDPLGYLRKDVLGVEGAAGAFDGNDPLPALELLFFFPSQVPQTDEPNSSVSLSFSRSREKATFQRLSCSSSSTPAGS